MDTMEIILWSIALECSDFNNSNFHQPFSNMEQKRLKLYLCVLYYHVQGTVDVYSCLSIFFHVIQKIMFQNINKKATRFLK